MARFRFFDYCEVPFDMGLEVTYLFNKKCEDKHFDIIGLGPEAVVFKRKWTALLNAEKFAPQRSVKIDRNPCLFDLNQHPKMFVSSSLINWTSYFGSQKTLHNIKKT